MKIQKGYSKKIGDTLLLRVANDKIEELQRLLPFNITVHQEESLKRYISCLYLEHPKKDAIFWIYIEENDTKKIVSSITLMPLEWTFNGILIPICEMGLVGTLPNYRNRGLIGVMNELYEEIMRQEGYFLSAIRGIPYYYRRFGYDFVLNLDERILLNKSQLPSRKIEKIEFQKATKQDLSFIESIYNKEQEQSFISNRFNSNNFMCKFMNDEFDDNFLSTFLINIKGSQTSFFSIGMSYDNTAVSLIVPKVNEESMIKILQFVKTINQDSDQIVFHVNSDSKFGQFICSIRGKKDIGYGWQIKIPDIKEFLHAISPVLEQRIEKSSYNGLSQDIVISDYRESFTLSFKNGKIESIEVNKGYPLPEICHVKIPGSALIKLLLSDKTFEEIKYIFKDSILKPGSEGLIKTLFPKKISMPDTYY